MRTKRSAKPKTIGAFIEEIAPDTWKSRRCLTWPPDAFVVCGAILQRSGGYTEILKNWPVPGTNLRKRAVTMKSIGRAWAEQAAFFDELNDDEIARPDIFLSFRLRPKRSLYPHWQKNLKSWADKIDTYLKEPIDDVYKHPALIEALMNICAVADEACYGVGQPGTDETWLQTRIAKRMQAQLEQSIASAQQNGCKLPATLCKYIHPSRALALPKLHTPQSGITLRSLSHHIAFCLANEVCPEWYSQYFNHLDHAFNVLVIPWPDIVEPSDFKVCDTAKIKYELPPRFGRFIYRPRGEIKSVGEIFQRAWNSSGKIDAVFFPEAAFGSQKLFDEVVEELLIQKLKLKNPQALNPILVIGGVLIEQSDGTFVNQACCKTVIWDKPKARWLKSEYIQHKHHAWKINGSQIINYGISSQLDPSKDWWEHISIQERDILFLALTSWLTICVVICEDLARPDPLTDVIRAVGPNLVLALLMDGPQLPQRWSGRYATVLADDPGSAVLSITSIGMAECCVPNGKTKSRTIGLWKDTYDAAQPITLDPGSSGVVLTLAREYKEEWSADGRSDGGCSGHLRLGGVLQVCLP